MNSTADEGDIHAIRCRTQAQGFTTMLGSGTCDVQWDDGVRATGLGGMVYFGHYLKESGLFGRWVASCPLKYTSNHAPGIDSVLATVVDLLSANRLRLSRMMRLHSERELAAMWAREGVDCADGSCGTAGGREVAR